MKDRTQNPGGASVKGWKGLAPAAHLKSLCTKWDKAILSDRLFLVLFLV